MRNVYFPVFHKGSWSLEIHWDVTWASDKASLKRANASPWIWWMLFEMKRSHSEGPAQIAWQITSQAADGTENFMTSLGIHNTEHVDCMCIDRSFTTCLDQFELCGETWHFKLLGEKGKNPTFGKGPARIETSSPITLRHEKIEISNVKADMTPNRRNISPTDYYINLFIWN